MAVMAEVTEVQTVIDAVRLRLRQQHPDGATLEVVPQGIRHEQDWWYVPVRPNHEPLQRYEYYEALAAVENELQRDEQITVLFLPMPPESSLGIPEGYLLDDSYHPIDEIIAEEKALQVVIAAVRRRLATVHPGGVTLDILKTKLRHEQDWWYVPVKPDYAPPRRYEYYEALGRVEQELLTEEGLTVLFIPVSPE